MKKSLKVLIILLIGIIFIPNVKAETYDGEYSIDYLLRNYNLVTLGEKDLNLPNAFLYPRSINTEYMPLKGGAFCINNIEGAILIDGDYDYYGTSNPTSSSFGSLAGNTKSFIKGTKGENATAVSELVTDSNYIDFSKMYASIKEQSHALAENAEYHINSAKLEISKPGNYTINNTASDIKNSNVENSYNNYQYYNTMLIKNYDKNSLYVFNYYNEYITEVPNIKIMENGSANAVSLKEYIDNGNEYTGNIIWNFPNLKYLFINFNNSLPQEIPGFSGHIIAPDATIELKYNFVNNVNNYVNNYYYGTIVTNFIDYLTDYGYSFNLKKANYSLNKKIVEEENSYFEEITDYPDDLYTRNYSVSDLLKNYSLVTLGKKAIDSKSKLLEYGNTPGSVKMFHITGQALIAGDLYGKVHENELDEYSTNLPKFDRTAFDMECNEACETYIKGNIFKDVAHDYFGSIAVIQPWDNMNNDNINYLNKVNMLFTSIDILRNSHIIGPGNATGGPIDNYISFDRLYDNIVAEQSAIEEGKQAKVGEDGIVHLIPGGNYVIEDISQVKEIVFDQFEKEKDELTIITIKNSGDISFPLISKDTGSYKGIVTNDYYGKEVATHLYEQDTFVQDSYHGNIVWNVPNATYIKLKENAPFAGHLIAPNADVETPETHFAGCFIVNSIYGEGNTEAHFYPITANLKCDCDEYNELTPTMKKRFSEYKLNKLLGGEATTIETTILGDEVQYREDIETLENIEKQCPSNSSPTTNPIVNIITNPETYRNLGFIVIIGGLITYTVVIKKKKIKG